MGEYKVPPTCMHQLSDNQVYFTDTYIRKHLDTFMNLSKDKRACTFVIDLIDLTENLKKC
jgi:hypothetical protein